MFSFLGAPLTPVRPLAGALLFRPTAAWPFGLARLSLTPAPRPTASAARFPLAAFLRPAPLSPHDFRIAAPLAPGPFRLNLRAADQNEIGATLVEVHRRDLDL